MLKTEMKILVSFNSTTDALAFEKLCKVNEIDGRMIPLPKKISAGCGIAWISPIEIKDKVKTIIKENNFKYEQMFEMEI